MSTTYKYQEQFAHQLAAEWLNGDQSGVRSKIRQLKNKAQAAYIAAQVTMYLLDKSHGDATHFVEFMHPSN